MSLPPHSKSPYVCASNWSLPDFCFCSVSVSDDHVDNWNRNRKAEKNMESCRGQILGHKGFLSVQPGVYYTVRCTVLYAVQQWGLCSFFAAQPSLKGYLRPGFCPLAGLNRVVCPRPAQDVNPQSQDLQKSFLFTFLFTFYFTLYFLLYYFTIYFTLYFNLYFTIHFTIYFTI